MNHTKRPVQAANQADQREEFIYLPTKHGYLQVPKNSRPLPTKHGYIQFTYSRKGGEVHE